MYRLRVGECRVVYDVNLANSGGSGRRSRDWKKQKDIASFPHYQFVSRTWCEQYDLIVKQPATG